jgi:hypothetical protein
VLHTTAEAFCAVSHAVSQYFGDLDRSQHHKEVKFYEDMQVLVEDMILQTIHIAKPGQFIPGPSHKDGEATIVQSAIFNVIVQGQRLGLMASSLNISMLQHMIPPLATPYLTFIPPLMNLSTTYTLTPFLMMSWYTHSAMMNLKT